jgi:hypothetical protein
MRLYFEGCASLPCRRSKLKKSIIHLGVCKSETGMHICNYSQDDTVSEDYKQLP